MPLVLQGNVTFLCSQPQPLACTFLSSNSSFLLLPATASTTGGFSVQFQFKTWNQEGLLLSVWLNPDPQILELQIRNSQLLLTLQSSGERKSQLSAGETTGHSQIEYSLELNLKSEFNSLLLISTVSIHSCRT